MDQLERLVAIEAIKNVKARYWYCMDTKDWAGLRDVFTDDVVFDMRGERAFARGESQEGLAALRRAGLLTARRQGRYVRHTVNLPDLTALDRPPGGRTALSSSPIRRPSTVACSGGRLRRCRRARWSGRGE